MLECDAPPLEGDERLARWIGGKDWLQPVALDRLFAEAEPSASAAVQRPDKRRLARRHDHTKEQWTEAIAAAVLAAPIRP